MSNQVPLNLKTPYIFYSEVKSKSFLVELVNCCSLHVDIFFRVQSDNRMAKLLTPSEFTIFSRGFTFIGEL